MTTLLIDNYDSFTYNLYQLLSQLDDDVQVKRNDVITIADINSLNPKKIVISPGPCTPDEAGISLALIKAFAATTPILGVCLGHQAIAQAFGGRVLPMQKVCHGKTAQIQHDGRGVFQNLPNPFAATRYHSLAVDELSLPECFEISARSEDGVIMGIRHKKYMVEGVQFHPESVLCAEGLALLKNFIS